MRWVGVLCVVGLLAAACGGGDDAETSVATTDPVAAVDCREDPNRPFQLLYEIPGPHDVEVTCDLVYKTAPSGADQTLDVYAPAGTSAGEALPAVIFFHFNGSEYAFWPTDREQPIAEDFKTGGDVHARVVASLGMVGITFNASSYPMRSDVGEVSEENMGHAAQDALDLLAYVADHAADLNVDPTRICVWMGGTGSMVGAFTALAGEPRPVCAVVFTGVLHTEFAGQYDPAGLVSADMPPFFIARANLDIESNYGLDHFVARAREAGADQVTVERVQGSQAFEIVEPDNPATPVAIAKALDFIMEHLGVTAP